MDGDISAKTMEQGANSALKDQDLTSGIHESVNQTVSARAVEQLWIGAAVLTKL